MTRTRLRLDRLDDRLAPSITPAQVFDALNQTTAGNQVLGFIAENPEYLVQRVYQPVVRDALIAAADRGDASVAVLDQFLADLQAKVASDPTQAAALTPVVSQVSAARFQALSVATVARLDLNYVNQALGISPTPPPGPTPVVPPVVPPVPPPPSPPAPDLTSDSGMTNSIPDVNAAGFTTLPNGVRIQNVQDGVGEAVEPGASVQVYYTGYLTNGTVFDSQRTPEPPATFSLNGVIPGFRDGLIGMRPGGIRNIVIPPDQGYGAAGTGTIPPNSTLVFQVKLISVTNP